MAVDLFAPVYSLGECSCHIWMIRVGNRVGRCGRCAEQPRFVGPAPAHAKTICKHKGSCRRG
jgi:hypothetical protein